MNSNFYFWKNQIKLFLYYQQVIEMLKRKLKNLNDTKSKYILSLSKPKFLLEAANQNGMSDSEGMRSTLVNKTSFSMKTIKTNRNYTKISSRDKYEQSIFRNTALVNARAQKVLFQIILCLEDQQFLISIRSNRVQDLLSQVKKYLLANKINSQIKMLQSIDKDNVVDYLLSISSNTLQFFYDKKIKLKPYYCVNKNARVDLHSYQILKMIGSGGFSKVFLVRCKFDGHFYAMKAISKSFILKRQKQKLVQNERNIMTMLGNSPFLTTLYQSFQSENFFIFIMEYCPGGQLFTLLKRHKRMSQEMARFYITEILIGLQQLHSHGIAYRDMKPENILLDREGHVKIADFGLAKPGLKTRRTFSFCGSPQYMPPQVVSRVGHSLNADFYSLGALLFELLTGLPPFYNKDPQIIYKRTLNEKNLFPSFLSANVQNLLEGLLCKYQGERLGSQNGVQQILSHQWFGKINKNSFILKESNAPISFSFKDMKLPQKKEEGIQLLLSQQLNKSVFTIVMPAFRFSRSDYINKISIQQKIVVHQEALLKRKSIKMAYSLQKFKKLDNFFRL